VISSVHLHGQQRRQEHIIPTLVVESWISVQKIFGRRRFCVLMSGGSARYLGLQRGEATGIKLLSRARVRRSDVHKRRPVLHHRGVKIAVVVVRTHAVSSFFAVVFRAKDPGDGLACFGCEGASAGLCIGWSRKPGKEQLVSARANLLTCMALTLFVDCELTTQTTPRQVAAKQKTLRIV
jgi:hypothetical protein